jgi:hypothetical protein
VLESVVEQEETSPERPEVSVMPKRPQGGDDDGFLTSAELSQHDDRGSWRDVWFGIRRKQRLEGQYMKKRESFLERFRRGIMRD